ncbi:LCP family protein [Kitasatospora aburaviensis]
MPAAKGKINAAYGLGGPQLAVATVEQNTGLRIDHYLQVNFTAFVSAVDALGGVRVCTAKPLRDEYSGLDLPAGTSTLDGAGALKYVRARHVDGSSDLGRMHRQQKFVAQLLHQVTSSGTLLNPVRLARVTDSVLGSVKADKDLGADDLVTLATRMKDLTAGRADFATVPLAQVDHQVPGWGSTVLWDQAAARALFDAVRSGRPLAETAAETTAVPAAVPAAGSPAAAPAREPSVAPEQVHVQVFNATGVPGLGARVDGDLRRAGFATTGAPSNAPAGTPPGRTAVRYDPRWAESARLLAAALPGAELTAVPGLGPTLQVYAGADQPGAGGAAATPPRSRAPARARRPPRRLPRRPRGPGRPVGRGGRLGRGGPSGAVAPPARRREPGSPRTRRRRSSARSGAVADPPAAGVPARRRRPVSSGAVADPGRARRRGRVLVRTRPLRPPFDPDPPDPGVSPSR